MRVIMRLVLITGLAVGGLAVVSAPAQSAPATWCKYSGQWYPHGWVGELGGNWRECSYGVWFIW